MELQCRTKRRELDQGEEPARIPVTPAFFSPFFLTMKLEPMNTLEDRAKTSPCTLSLDITIVE